MKAKKYRLLASCALLLAAGFTGACFSFEKSYPEKRFYVLDTVREDASPRPAEGPVLRLTDFNISPRYEGKGFVTSRDDLSFESDFYNEFFIGPAEIIEGELREWLEGSGRFSLVTDPSSRVEADFLLTGNVPALFGDFREEGAPKAVLEIQFLLLDEEFSRSRVLFQNNYRQAVAIPDTSPGALARGWNQGLEMIFKALEADLHGLEW
jgi:cholesterol transport system auxiliary component